MNTSMFCNPTLSARLEKLGVTSQFKAGWIRKNQTSKFHFSEHIADLELWKNAIRSYHWSDLCMPDAAKKIWGERGDDGLTFFAPSYENTHKIINAICSGQDWQSWLTEQLDKTIDQLEPTNQKGV